MNAGTIAGAPVVALGVTGSIAAYKAAELTSMFRHAGMDVHVVMTAAALQLVCARTFLTLSRNPVTTDLWSVPDWQPDHIELASRANVLLIAPATANILAKMAHGIADDALSTLCVAYEGKTIVAPAMNPRMWRNPATQENCGVLRRRGVEFVGPAAGEVACGDTGVGRLAPVDEIFQAVRRALG